MSEIAKGPGWDARAISEIATREFGGFEEMFDHFGWPERGSEMLPQVQRRVADRFRSIEKFVGHYAAERRQ